MGKDVGATTTSPTTPWREDMISIKGSLTMVVDKEWNSIQAAIFQKHIEATHTMGVDKEWNSIQAAIFQKHIGATHPTITSNEMPPDHTLIINTNITNSQAKNSNQKNDNIYVIGLLQLVGMQML
jgi:hypothetical protein